MPRRNLETNVENEETILNELKAARKELKKREDDPILLDKIKALKLRLEKVKQESDFRDEYKDDPSLAVSRARHAPPRRRRDSSPSEKAMGGLRSKFEPVRTESRLERRSRSRLGPNGPKLGKETTHRRHSRKRVASTA